MTDSRPAQQDWPETLATVVTCAYHTRAGRALAFGLPSSKQFHITYNYWANDRLHTAELFTDKPIPQGSLFPIRYNPEEPHTSKHTDAQPSPRSPLVALGIAASVVLSFAWLLYLRGCTP